MSSPQVALFPSGSDAEYLPFIVGLIRSYDFSRQHGLNEKSVKVLNYVVAAGEVGSGTPQAATAQHFSPVTPRGGSSQVAGHYLTGMRPDSIELITYKPRDANGEVAFQEQALIEDIVTRLTSYSASKVAILHLASLNQSSQSTVPSMGWFNYGLSLRWWLSLDLMERYASIPISLVQRFTSLWVHRCDLLIERLTFHRTPGRCQ